MKVHVTDKRGKEDFLMKRKWKTMSDVDEIKV